MSRSTSERTDGWFSIDAEDRFSYMRIWFVAVTLLLVLPTVILGQAVGQSAEETSIGNVEFPTSCSTTVADGFERGVALLHHMMYVEARKTFQDVAQQDPDCAMAQWGVAMTMFQPLWPTRPTTEDLNKGWDTINKAMDLGADTQREKDYVAAVQAFYQDPDSSDYWARIQNFEQAMAQVHQSYPDDQEAAVFYALSLLATASRSEDRMAQHTKAADILMGIYRAERKHPGAVHYTIHANDMDGRENVSLDVVRSYDNIAPSVPHALHMPTHIFVRLGEWEDVITWNNRSAIAALNYPAGEATSHHYLHALDYQVYAHLQRAEDGRAEEIMKSLEADTMFQETFISAYALAAIPARYVVERREWDEAASLADPNPQAFPVERFPWPMSITEFARGLGAARSGNGQAAEQAIERLSELKAAAEAANETYFAEQIEVSRLAVAAWLARAQGEDDKAVEMMQSSAELEASMEKHPVTPGAIQPAYELFGDLLMELDRHDGALAAYQTSLKTWPGRFNSLLGAAKSAAAAGDRSQAMTYYAELVELTGDANESRSSLNEARAYLAQN